MKELVLQNLSEIMTYLLGVVKSGINLVSDNAPIIIQQLLAYKMKTTILCTVIASILFVLCAALTILLFRTDYYEDYIVITIPLLVIPSFIWLVFEIVYLIQLKTAPFVYLLEYISSLIK